MKFSAPIILFVLAIAAARADETPPELKALEARYNQADLAKNEPLRVKYVMDLAKLRFQFVRHDQDGWQAVDAEIERHPAPADSDEKAFSKALTGVWHSPRHDYLNRADGTWVMDPDEKDPDATHGTWSIRGNQYSSIVADDDATKTSYTIILLDADNFIYFQPGSPALFFEKRSLHGGFPLRRDEQAH